MRAVYYERKGPASRVLVLGELPDPQPGPGEVRVKLHFSGINPTDTKLRGGWDGSMEMPFPRVIPLQDGGIQGQAVLVAGGAGAVGHAAIQLAKWGGARVATTVSRPEQEKVAREAGADLVVNRKTEDAAARIGAFTRGLGVDRVVEVAFEANLELNRAVLKPNGVISTYSSGPPESAPRIPFTAIMRQGISVHFILVYVMPREAHW